MFDLLSNERAAIALHRAQVDELPKNTKSREQTGTYCFSATSSVISCSSLKVLDSRSCSGLWDVPPWQLSACCCKFLLHTQETHFFVGLVNKREVGGRAGGVPHDITAWCLLSNQRWKSHIPSFCNTTALMCQHMTANLHKAVLPGCSLTASLVLTLALTPTRPPS